MSDPFFREFFSATFHETLNFLTFKRQNCFFDIWIFVPVSLKDFKHFHLEPSPSKIQMFYNFFAKLVFGLWAKFEV